MSYNLVKFINAAKYIYGAGILGSSILELRNANISLNNKVKKGKSVNTIDYTMTSMIGIIEGTYNGMFLPITLLGKIIALPMNSSENENK